MRLVEFLTARLDEEQRVAEQAQAMALPEDHPDTEWFANQADSSGDSIVAMYPSRALADIAAKRAIVERCGREVRQQELNARRYDFDTSERHALRALASVYADHADYREEWRP